MYFWQDYNKSDDPHFSVYHINMMLICFILGVNLIFITLYKECGPSFSTMKLHYPPCN